ncbi:MAG: hypothetical protein ACP5IL_02745 [Syntrophobacteraceae bacterium]
MKKDLNRQPRVLLHAGLHKTGTTTVQTFLSSCSEQLREAGFLYPRTGTVFEAHFNIAWQLTRDRRFSKSRGTIEDLAKEIEGFNGDIILSCEDFESILDQPERFAPLRFHPAFAGREFIVLVYLRNQNDYAQSLYLQLLRHGYGQEFSLFVEQVLGFRKFQFDEWAFHFDYGQLYSRWLGCPWAQFRMRNYHQLEGDSILTDFLGFLDPSLSPGDSEKNLRCNQRDTIQKSLHYFYSNRCKGDLTEDEKETLTHMYRALQGKHVTVPNEVRSQFHKIFSVDNKSLCAKAALPDKGLVDMGTVSEGIFPLGRLFSFELANCIAGNRSLASEENSNANELWRYAQDLGNGWKWLDWLGYFTVLDRDWIHHEQHGTLRCFATSPDDITFWDQDMKAFWWTSDLMYPYIYRFIDQTWLFYEKGSSGPRKFYNFNRNTHEDA